MLKIPLIYLKDKQAFRKEDGTLKIIGKPADLARDWKKEGVKLIHIIDMDAMNGNTTNFDVYDTLTYIMNVQVEGANTEKMIAKLLNVDARVIIELPTKLNLSKFSEKKRLMVGKITDAKDMSNDVYDIYYPGTDEKTAEKLLKTKRRIILTSTIKINSRIKPFGKVEI
jgi:phosphoribosylformimino-5-aminoimidazole carboxamide ribonucleotide (ProFAR) isomerase